VTYIQVITPNPDVPCTPGWCLQYVRQAYGLPARYSSATEAWDNSTSQHTDWDFPDCWVPVWFSLATEPAGHVALRAPDGSVYSSSDANTSTPHHHPSLDDLISYYAAGNPLTYLGWTEDVASYPVIADSSIGYESTIITPVQEDDLTPEERATLFSVLDKINTSVAALPQPQYWNDLINAVARVDGAVPNLPAAVLNVEFILPDGTVTNLAGILSAINAKPVTAGTVVTTPATDPQAIADAVLSGIQTQWSKP